MATTPAQVGIDSASEMDPTSLPDRPPAVSRFQVRNSQPIPVDGGGKRAQDKHRVSVRKHTGKTKIDKGQTTIRFLGTSESTGTGVQPEVLDEEQRKTLHRIQSHPSLTPYRKRLYTALLSVPRGRYTTYAAMSDHLDSSARAVGNGMRNNPFAPEVPCHRVLAANGTIGGFKGDWGKDGKHAAQKVELLRSEGVRFDGSGKVIGEPFRQFHDFSNGRRR